MSVQRNMFQINVAMKAQAILHKALYLLHGVVFAV
jgi:hypothetical protein